MKKVQIEFDELPFPATGTGHKAATIISYNK